MHEQQLRRALLNSSYLSPSWLVRFKQRWPHDFFSWPVTIGALSFGLLLAWTAGPWLGASDAAPGPAETLTEGNSAEVIQALDHHGQLRYSGEDESGAAVYLVNMNGQTFELHDRHAAIQKLISQ